MATTGAAEQQAETTSWRKSFKRFAATQVRQVPCLSALIPTRPAWCKRRAYQSLGQEEEEKEAATVEESQTDERQRLNWVFGHVLTKIAIFLMLGATLLVVLRNSEYEQKRQKNPHAPGSKVHESDEERFRHDAPVVLYVAVLEILVCGACAQAAATMYKRRRHMIQHPADAVGREKLRYIRVDLEKDPGCEDTQLYGMGFRPSSDGLECLIVETIRNGSILDKWNRRLVDPSPEQMVEEALGVDEGDEANATGDLEDGTAAEPTAAEPAPTRPVPSFRQNLAARRLQRVYPFATIVAVNDAFGDVGLMQVQLMKPKVTLWVHTDVCHISQFEDRMFAAPEREEGPYRTHQTAGSARTVATDGIHIQTGDDSIAAHDAQQQQQQQQQQQLQQQQQRQQLGLQAQPRPMFVGRTEADVTFGSFLQEVISVLDALPTPAGPSCACVTFEDEEPQILIRWMACSIIFGWVTLLPVVFVQPHEERPRQKLFREFLRKPCLVVLPIWVTLWALDCAEMLFMVQIMPPFVYFGVCHVILPGVLVWFMIKLQAADEQLILEQRKTREADTLVPLAVEDPSPVFLKELITMNPVALIWVGACAAIPLLISNLLTPLETARGKMAQGFITLIYTPLCVAQIGFLYVLWHTRFVDLPKLYMAGFALLLSVPCFIVWCVCLASSSRYGKQDLTVVEKQRFLRGKGALRKLKALRTGVDVEEEAPTGVAAIVDLTEAQHQQWQLINTA